VIHKILPRIELGARGVANGITLDLYHRRTMTEQAVLWEAGTRPRRRNTISTTSSGVDNNILNRIEIGGETDALTACHVNTDNKEGESSYHYAEEPLKLPPSTHSLLFIEPIYSLPFFMSVLTAAICYASLILALIYNVSNGEVPPNVETSVRIAQYLAVGIAMVMEDEVPIGIYLLRRLPKAYLRTKFPEIRYWRFVASNAMRISLGYLFLINVLYIVLIADDVLAIFYDGAFIFLLVRQQSHRSAKCLHCSFACILTTSVSKSQNMMRLGGECRLPPRESTLRKIFMTTRKRAREAEV